MKIKFLRPFIMFVILMGCLTGCYHIAPEEGEISTVPVTNNPHAMPGPMKTSAMPSVF